ncbi:MAG: nucleotide exchange factor GrpE [Chloroflexi bacterium]|nr:nucleotide exchange factor GrpE [Chloroflexota bacterium]
MTEDQVVEQTIQDEEQNTNGELDAARAEAAEYKDRWLRAQAEFQNFRKRQERESAEARAMASADMVKTLLPVLDDFDRAFRNVPEEYADDSWINGFRLIERKFKQVLEQAGVKPIETVGKTFNPNFHESVASEERDEPHGTILEEYRKGYILNDKVLRPAMVKIAQ